MMGRYLGRSWTGAACLALATFAFTVLAARVSHAEWPGGPLKVDQGPDWSQSYQAEFYTLDQGSRIMPLAWMSALKQPDGMPFLADSLVRYGYLPNDRGGAPGLPVGFVAAGARGKQMVGMTCAACHTRQITFAGYPFRIDGGPAIVDFQAFLQDLDTAVSAALGSDDSFKGFARAVVGHPPKPSEVTALRAEVSEWETRYHAIVDGSLKGVTWGVSRLDAVSMIFNRLAGLDLGQTSAEILKQNIAPADAPVRYPFLWNAAFQDKTQWPGFAPNGNYVFGLLRNVGEVIGVFAEFHPAKIAGDLPDFACNSSANFEGLKRLEWLMAQIGPPKWPWQTDDALRQQGEKIYARPSEPDQKHGGCIECHQVPAEPRPLLIPWRTELGDVGTDTREYQVINRQVDTGILNGAFVPGVGTLQENDSAVRTLKASVAGSLLGSAAQSIFPGMCSTLGRWGARLRPLNALADMYGDDAVEQLNESNPSAKTTEPVYEARVLRGIWAAAPYLHNGSVRSLSELLKPPAERDPSFPVGPEYDPVDVGLAKNQTKFNYVLKTTDCTDTGSGNSRCGHEYGTELSDDEKKALLEYLKSL